MTSISATARTKTTAQSPEPHPRDRVSQPGDEKPGDLRLDQIEPEAVVHDLEADREEITDSALGRGAVRLYVSLMSRAPTSTRGRVIFGLLVFLIIMAPSMALLYFSVTAGQEATENWFGNLGYAGVFLANLASTATLFIPVPGLTAAAQALIASSGNVLSPFWVGVLGGLGMAIGEITAYVAGMATSVIVKEEEIKPPSRFRPLIEKITGAISWLMHKYGMATLFILSVVPNPAFEIAGWTAGATRYPFWKFMAAVTPGKVCRGLLLAYVGSNVFDWALDLFEPLVSAVAAGAG